MGKAWIGVDLDKTLAEYNGWPSDGSIGKPIPKMVERVKHWLAKGHNVRIFTARVYPLGTQVIDSRRKAEATFQHALIEAWCARHIGEILPITCIKDPFLVELWDDRAIQVVGNTGERVGEELCE